ncbi:hypothetical protein ACPB9J_33710 [Streptomyces lavendulocolor]|uniref:hypothetical protein n=1 Tax=Streptomyces lavendulocolor TaxID=67316 RepID=UPI003C2E4668
MTDLTRLREQTAEATARADRLSATLSDILSRFVHHGHPGEPCLQTGWIDVKTVERWRAALSWNEPSWQCHNCGGLVPQSQEDMHLRAEAEAALDRVRSIAEHYLHDSGDGTDPCAAAILDVLGARQSAPAGSSPVHIGGRANAEDCPACRLADTPPPYPWICPGDPQPTAAPDQQERP